MTASSSLRSPPPRGAGLESAPHSPMFVHACAVALCALATAAAHGADTLDVYGAPVAKPAASAPGLRAADPPALVGVWQEGLDAPFRNVTPERAKQLRALVGDVLEFRADHTLIVYPRCSQRAGIVSVAAHWELVDDRTVRVSSEHDGKKIERSTQFKVTGDQLAFIEQAAANPQLFARYVGTLPPACE